MSAAIWREAARLIEAGTPFVLATVVAKAAPQSARPGAKAILLPDGELVGWVGGGCVRPTVLREALAALADGRPRLVRIDPDAEPDTRAGVRVYPMICKGEGAVDVYLEPVAPDPELLIIGRTPVAEALARIAPELGLSVRVASAAASAEAFPRAQVVGDVAVAAAEARPGTFVVVATMGEDDEAALEAAAGIDAAYVGLVASRKKGAALLDYLVRERDVPEERLRRVKFPAGLDLGGAEPAEIALSILAEIVVARRAGEPATAASVASVPADDEPRRVAAPVPPGDELTALDPVCGMAVETRSAGHTYELDGQSFYFCCPNCRARFVRDPARYLAPSAREP